MDKKTLTILAACILLILAFLLHNYVFSIYETRILADKEELFADGHSQIQIMAEPINGLGFKAPFRSAQAAFTLEEGSELVDIVRKSEADGVLILKAKYATGKVVVMIKPRYAMFPTKITIIISQNAA
ncbi:MAG: hypothetical protein HYV28_19775 [Ignavibacteriales bacterium]|nr:hypothetical protein [Ignavibacteriales bacterium]